MPQVNGSLCRRLSGPAVLLLLACLWAVLRPGPVLAEVNSYLRAVSYRAGRVDDQYTSRAVALETAKQQLFSALSEDLGREPAVRKSGLTRNELARMAGCLVRPYIVGDTWTGRLYRLQVRFEADPARLGDAVESLRRNRQAVAELAEARGKAERYLADAAALSKKAAAASKSGLDALKDEYRRTIRLLSAVDWFERGFSYLLEDRYGEAIRAFTRTVELDPGYAAAYSNRGVARARNGDHQAATEDYNRAVALDPAYTSSRDVRWFHQGALDRAVADYTRVVDNDPLNAEAYLRRGAATAAAGDYDRAITDYNRALEINPNFGWALVCRGMAWFNTQDYDRAEADFNTALEVKPLIPNAHCGLGYVLEARGLLPQALEATRKALDIEPNNRLFQTRVAHIESRIKRRLAQPAYIPQNPCFMSQSWVDPFVIKPE
ncbi:MAG: tetratricopeptide repeat protein [Proteobacteria bacterium]|nr:tetratricopeptide repeat protein [Pseudomonadota bacterium]